MHFSMLLTIVRHYDTVVNKSSLLELFSNFSNVWSWHNEFFKVCIPGSVPSHSLSTGRHGSCSSPTLQAPEVF